MTKLPKLDRDIAALVGIARKETDVAKIEAAIVEARAQSETAAHDRAAAEQAYRDGLLDAAPADLQRRLDEIAAAKVRLDQAEAVVAALVQRLAAVRDLDARAARQAIHDEAAAKCAVIEKRLAAEYPKLATAMRALLSDLADAELARERAEREAPDLDLIRSPEAAVRGLYAVPEEVLERTEVERWMRDHQPDQPVPDEALAKIRRDQTNPRIGAYPNQAGGTFRCHLQRFDRVRYRQEMRSPSVDHLWQAVALPGLRATDEDFVTPERFRSLDTASEHLGRPLTPRGPLEREERVRFEPIHRQPDEPPTRHTVVPMRSVA